MSYDFLKATVDGWVSITTPAAERFLQTNTEYTTSENEGVTTYSIDNVPVLRRRLEASQVLYEVFQFKGDLDLTGNKINLIRDVGQLKQAIEQGLRTDTGEWFANINYGIPYIDQILSVKNSLGLLNTQVLAFLATFPEIVEVLSFESEIDPLTRTASLRFEAMTSYNETIELTVELL